MKNSKFLFITAIFLLLSGVALVIIGIYLLVRAYSISWQPVNAQVVSTTVKSRWFQYQDVSMRQLEYYPQITYRYRVGDTWYTASKYRLYTEYEPSFDKSIARHHASQYPRGKMLIAYYDRDNPTTVVLDKHVGWEKYVALILGCLFIGCGWGLRCLLWQTTNANQSTSKLACETQLTPSKNNQRL